MIEDERSIEDTNKLLVRRAIEASNNREGMKEFIAVDLIDHAVASDGPQGMQGFHAHTTLLNEAFPDFATTIDMLIAEGDKVVLLGTSHGTHKGDFLGFKPTNKEIRWSGMRVYRIAEGKIAEAWGVYDRFGILQQLGVLPPLGQ